MRDRRRGEIWRNFPLLNFCRIFDSDQGKEQSPNIYIINRNNIY